MAKAKPPGGERRPATLYVFAGLPGTGKSTLARVLASEVAAVYLRIDTIEQALRDLCALDVQGEGYRLAYRIAADNLRLGMSVVADSCNPIELTRREWAQVATDAGALCRNVEIVCSDENEHRARVELREPDVPGLRLPGWSEVLAREYDRWTTPRIVIDTAGQSVSESTADLLEKLQGT